MICESGRFRCISNILARSYAFSQYPTVPDTWWNALNLELQIFYGIGILALLVLLIQLRVELVSNH